MGSPLANAARSSIVPVILTFLITEIPTLALTADLILRHYHPLPLALLSFLLQTTTTVCLLLCVYTDPGILPQVVDRYEPTREHLGIPAVNHLPLEEHKYLMVNGGLFLHQKYCVECCVYRPVRTIHCSSCNHCV